MLDAQSVNMILIFVLFQSEFESTVAEFLATVGEILRENINFPSRFLGC
jgi:hypothetical protein